MWLALFHFASARVDRHQIGNQSRPCRRLAAAANGPITKLTSDSAHRIENGVPNDNGPDIAACEAATPKINTGIDSGSTSTASNNPPRCSVTASAAPIMPVKVSAGVPASSVNATAEVDPASRFKSSPKTGVAITSGNPAASQCASALAAQASSSGVRPITIRSSEPSSWSAVNNRSSVSRLASNAPSQSIAGPSRVRSARSGPTANGISTTTVRKNSTPISAPPPTRSAIWMSLRIRAARAVMRCGPATIPPQTFAQVDPHPRPLPARGRGAHARSIRRARLPKAKFPYQPREVIGSPQGRRFAPASRHLPLPSPLRGGVGGGGATPGPSRFSPDPQFSRLYPQRRVGRGDDQAASGEMITHQGGKQALSGGVEGIGRLIQQPDRPPYREQPGDREPPPLSGRQIGCRQVACVI